MQPPKDHLASLSCVGVGKQNLVCPDVHKIYPTSEIQSFKLLPLHGGVSDKYDELLIVDC